VRIGVNSNKEQAQEASILGSDDGERGESNSAQDVRRLPLIFANTDFFVVFCVDVFVAIRLSSSALGSRLGSDETGSLLALVDAVSSNSKPDDMRFAMNGRLPKLEQCATVSCPAHFKGIRPPMKTLYPQTCPKWAFGLEIFYQVSYCRFELRALLRGEARQVFEKFCCAFGLSASGSPRGVTVG
jgi:hypothetical protein